MLIVGNRMWKVMLAANCMRASTMGSMSDGPPVNRADGTAPAAHRGSALAARALGRCGLSPRHRTRPADEHAAGQRLVVGQKRLRGLLAQRMVRLDRLQHRRAH